MEKRNLTRSVLAFVLTLCLFVLGSTQLSAQSYVSSQEAISKLTTEMETIATQSVPGSDLTEEMAKTLSVIISDGTTVADAVQTVFQSYDNQTATRPVVANYLEASKTRIENLLKD